MKINWGTGIALTLVVFVGSMFFLIWISYQQELNLVSDDYYIKGLKYEEQIEKQRNTASLDTKISFNEDANQIIIQFPTLDSLQKPSGSIYFYKPSDNKLDRRFKIQLNDSLCQYIQKKELVKGYTVIKVDYIWGGKSYYQESSLTIQ